MEQNMSNETRQKGSALLVSLMVMVGLSMLGLGFVAMSETESAIGVNQRNYAQAQAAAEAGAKIAVEWLQDAQWAYDHNMLPPNKKDIKTQRIHKDGTKTYYKESAGQFLFDIPFKIYKENRFYGNENTPDVVITRGANTTATDFLDKLNKELFTDASVRISDIRVYAPPMPGAELVNQTGGKTNTGFWDDEGGTVARYGVATIRVTGQKMAGNRVVAQRSVKLVVAETPFPTVDGAIETSGSLVGQGNFHVYWGKILSEKETQVNRPAVGMPWFDAKDQMYFEYGYDTSTQWIAGATYAVGDVVHATDSAISADGELAKFSFRCTIGGPSAGTEPGWSKSVGTTVVDAAGVTWVVQPSKPYRIDTSDFYSGWPWLYSLLGAIIEDPWLHARARGTITLGNNKTTPCGQATNPHPCDFAANTENVAGRYSNMFQLQTHTDPSDPKERIEVFFPTMDYEFWRAVAQAGDNQPGNDLYYFKYEETSGMFIGPNGVKKTMEDWLNAHKNGLGAGFYFFDSKNGKNPQYGKGGTLTPGIKINSAVGKPWQMQGYIYMNAEAFGTTGAGNMIDDDVYNMPGEPYRDIGYREIDTVTKKFKLTGSSTLPGGDYVNRGANNKIWDFQDVNENGVFDYHVAKTTKDLTRPNTATIAAGSVWLPVPWYEGCTVPDLSDMKAPVAGNCSEPHEPYVNLLYPDKSQPKSSLTVGWHDPADAAKRKPKKRTGVNTGESCTKDSSLRDCTSNGYDIDGGLVTLAPVLHGALYNEGGYSGSGNAVYYGAVLMRGNFDATGTPEVFFNECLARGCLEAQLEMQRVMVTSFETDQ